MSKYSGPNSKQTIKFPGGSFTTSGLSIGVIILLIIVFFVVGVFLSAIIVYLVWNVFGVHSVFHAPTINYFWQSIVAGLLLFLVNGKGTVK